MATRKRARKARRTCGACEAPLRRGATRIVHVVERDGSIAQRLVCVGCTMRAARLVVASPVQVAPPCAFCHREPAAVCLSCADRLAAQVRELTACNVALAAQHTPKPEGEK